MMDPYVALLLEAMESKFTSALVYAVKVINLLLFNFACINLYLFFCQAFVVIIEMKNVPSVSALIERVVTKVFSLLLVLTSQKKNGNI
jgi:hypothetical protein